MRGLVCGGSECGKVFTRKRDSNRRCRRWATGRFAHGNGCGGYGGKLRAELGYELRARLLMILWQIYGYVSNIASRCGTRIDSSGERTSRSRFAYEGSDVFVRIQNFFDLAYRKVSLGKIGALRLFYLHVHVVRIGCREEDGLDDAGERKRERDEEERNHAHDKAILVARIVEESTQEALIPRLRDTIVCFLAFLNLRMLIFHEENGKERYESECHEYRGKKDKNNRERYRGEEFTNNARKEEQRYEDHDCSECAGNERPCVFTDSGHSRFLLVPILQKARVECFHHHDAGIHENTDGKDEREERNIIKRIAGSKQSDEGNEKGKRY